MTVNETEVKLREAQQQYQQAVEESELIQQRIRVEEAKRGKELREAETAEAEYYAESWQQLAGVSHEAAVATARGRERF